MSLSDGIPIRVIGRYAIHEEIASGGMATVHFGRLVSAGGFSRTVAIKRLHAHLARDPEFVKMFLDEARIAARIRHPNVVPVLDVVNTEGEIFLVMEYVAGESLALLARAVRDRGERIPFPIAAALVVGVLRGLHAAHEATDERGQPLCIVHRDVSPQNILVGRDGSAHLLDFGVAKAEGQLQTTREGRIKGKVGYMPPEQARGSEVTRAVDIYAAGVVLWELLTGERLFAGDNDAIVLERVLFGEVVAPSGKGAPPELDEVVMRALGKVPESRFSTAREMARAIEAAVDVASGAEITEWLEMQAGGLIEDRQRRAAALAQGRDRARCCAARWSSCSSWRAWRAACSSRHGAPAPPRCLRRPRRRPRSPPTSPGPWHRRRSTCRRRARRPCRRSRAPALSRRVPSRDRDRRRQRPAATRPTPSGQTA